MNNRDISLKELEYKVFHCEKKFTKKISKHKNLDEYFKIAYLKKENIID